MDKDQNNQLAFARRSSFSALVCVHNLGGGFFKRNEK